MSAGRQTAFGMPQLHKVYLPFFWIQRSQKLCNFHFAFIKVIGNGSLVMPTFEGKIKLYHEKLMLFSVPH